MRLKPIALVWAVLGGGTGLVAAFFTLELVFAPLGAVCVIAVVFLSPAQFRALTTLAVAIGYLALVGVIALRAVSYGPTVWTEVIFFIPGVVLLWLSALLWWRSPRERPQ